MSAKKIFISYSRRDTEYVKSLVEALRKQGFDVWFDKNIRTGTDWDDTIESELKNADAIVLILSKTSVASDNVKDEISYAIGLNKPVNPIKIEECDVPMRLARKQFVDFTAMGHEAGFERLVNDLKISLKEAETSVTKGTFKPPKNTSVNNNEPAKGSKKIVPYIITGIVSIIIFILILMNCDGENTTETEMDDSVTEEISDNPEWQNAENSNSIDNYIKYIYKLGPEDEYFGAAQSSIDILLPNVGVVLYKEANGTKHFIKNLYSDVDGDWAYGQDDNYDPRKGDILSAINMMEIIDPDDNQIIPNANIISGQKVRVLAVDFMDDDSIYITVRYSDL